MTFIIKVRWKKITIGKVFQLNILCEKRVLFEFKIWKKTYLHLSKMYFTLISTKFSFLSKYKKKNEISSLSF